MEEALVTLLRGSAAVTALVPAGQINWRRHPQGQPLPGIVLHLINAAPRYALAAVGDVRDVRVQATCLGTDYAAAKAVARAVSARLSGYQAGAFYQVRIVGERDVEQAGVPVPGEPAVVMLDFVFIFRG